eukprot:g41035.t1
MPTQALNRLIADTKFQPQVIVPEEDTDRIQAGESPDDIRVFPTESLLAMKLTELNPSDMSTIPPRGFPIAKIKEKFMKLRQMLNILISANSASQGKYQESGQEQPDISQFLHCISPRRAEQQICYLYWWVHNLRDTFSQSLLTVVPEVYDQLINPSAAGPTALPSNKKSSKCKNTDILIHDLLVKHSMKMDGHALQDNYSTAQKNLISIDNMLSSEQDPTKRRRLLKQKEYWELEMDDAFEDIKKEKKKKKKKKIAVDPSSRAQKRVRSLQESDSDADQVSNSKAEV